MGGNIVALNMSAKGVSRRSQARHCHPQSGVAWHVNLHPGMTHQSSSSSSPLLPSPSVPLPLIPPVAWEMFSSWPCHFLYLNATSPLDAHNASTCKCCSMVYQVCVYFAHHA